MTTLARRFLPPLAVATAISLGAPDQAAQPHPKEVEAAKKLFKEAEKDEEAKRWLPAAEKLEQILKVKETAGVRFHYANCLENLGRLTVALENYERSRTLAVENKVADVNKLIGPRIDALRTRLPFVIVRIRSQEKPTAIVVDGNDVGAGIVDKPIAVDPGYRTVVVEFLGRPPARKTLDVQERKTVEFDMTPSGDPPAAGSASAPKDSASASAPAPAAPPPPPPTRSIPTGGWIALGAGLALGVGGYLAYNKAGSIADESASTCARLVRCDPDRVDAVRKWDAAALGLWIGAGVGLGVGAWLVLSSPSKPQASTTSLVLAPSNANLRVTF